MLSNDLECWRRRVELKKNHKPPTASHWISAVGSGGCCSQFFGLTRQMCPVHSRTKRDLVVGTRKMVEAASTNK